MKALVSIDYAIQGKRLDHPHHTESWLAYIGAIQKTVDSSEWSGAVQPFGAGCWLCSASSLAPLLEIVLRKRGDYQFSSRVVFLTPEDEETLPKAKKTAPP